MTDGGKSMTRLFRLLLLGALVLAAPHAPRGAGAQPSRPPSDGAHRGYLAARLPDGGAPRSHRRAERRPPFRARIGAQGRDGGGRAGAPRPRLPLAHPPDDPRSGGERPSRRRPRRRAGSRSDLGRILRRRRRGAARRARRPTTRARRDPRHGRPRGGRRALPRPPAPAGPLPRRSPVPPRRAAGGPRGRRGDHHGARRAGSRGRGAGPGAGPRRRRRHQPHADGGPRPPRRRQPGLSARMGHRHVAAPRRVPDQRAALHDPRQRPGARAACGTAPARCIARSRRCRGGNRATPGASPAGARPGVRARRAALAPAAGAAVGDPHEKPQLVRRDPES